MKFKMSNRWIPIFLLALAILIAWRVINNVEFLIQWILSGLGMLGPFFASFGIAYILHTPCGKLKRLIEKSKLEFIQKSANALSVIGIYLLLFGVIGLALSLLIPALSHSLVQLVGSIPGYYTEIIHALDTRFNIKIEDMNIQQNIQTFLNQFSLTDIGSYAQGVMGIFQGTLNVVLAIIASIYMLIDQKRLLSGAKRILTLMTKGKVEDKILAYAGKMNDIFLKFLYSQFFDAVIIWILSTILLAVMRVDFWLLFGVVIGLFNMIPYFGSIFSGLLTAVITIFTGSWEQGLAVAIALLILQQIDGNIIGPRIVGGSLNIRPLMIIIAIFIGGRLFGVLGMFLAVPVAAILRIIFIEYFEFLEGKREGRERNNEKVI